jgi:carboxylesterase
MRRNNPSEYHYMPGAEPFFHRGGSVGCLVLHGFMASPNEVRWMSQHLAAAGHTVLAPRMPGHGTYPSAMARMRWQDWLATVMDGIHVLRGACDSVFVVGHSMGGTLGLLAAARESIEGLAAMAAPIELRGPASWGWLKYILPYTDQTDKTHLPPLLKEEQARRGEPVLGRVRYDRWSTGAVHQLYRLVQAARIALPDINTPLCLINAAQDPTVAFHQQDIIAKNVSSKVIECHTLENGGHILPQDVERERVFELVAAFIASRVKQA